MAQTDYPARPVRIVVPFSAGGSTDQIARSLAEGLSKLWQQPVVIENRDGASGLIGSRVVAESQPDGYTLLFGTQTTQSVLPHIVSQMSYDAERAFVPITELVSIAQVLSVPPSSPFRSLAEFVTYAKGHPGELTFGGGVGATTHMAMELFMSQAGIQLLGIPYKGSALSMNDLLAGRLDSMFDVIMTSLPHIQAGRLRALAVTSAQRQPLLPDVPTVAELGYSGFETNVWFALFAPQNTPTEIVQKIAEDSRKVMTEPARRRIFNESGFQIIASDPATFAERVRLENEKWRQVVKRANIKLE
ncbi:Bug family tripartite tricarboxylate transporter substrate binding protein [Bordetella muralis]|uniref:Bug family tripartite tricarboxylate transporter substrate binding protein n=1 Tax=Bordetella muralis TaxID=1649130 RepID=UPI0039EFC454